MSDLGDDRDPQEPNETLLEQFLRCAHCGATLPREEWCPISTDTDAAGNLAVRTFCDEECMDRFGDRGASDSGSGR